MSLTLRRRLAAPSAVVRRAAVRLPATCGELFQGTVDGDPCLVSCPIARFGTAEVELLGGVDWDTPANSAKAATAVRAGLAHFGSESGGRLRLRSGLPRGRGYGSSTVDVGATLLALGQALGAAPSPAEVARLAVTVEPTDSTLFPGLALFAHRDGCRHAPLGPSPPLEVLVLDPGGEVDTVRFNKADHDATLRGLSADHAEAFELLRGSLAGHDWEGMGEAATLSARAHQAILPDELGPVAWHLARDVGALGVCRAHSGTLWGVLIDPARCDVHGTFTYLLGRVPQGVDAYRERLAEGGPQRIDSSEDV